jgi:hypothetical protein
MSQKTQCHENRAPQNLVSQKTRRTLRRDVPKFQSNYAKAALTFAISMMSICYADMLARRNAVAKFACN